MIGKKLKQGPRKSAQRLERENREIGLANRILRVFVEETGDALYDKALEIVMEGMKSRHGVFGYIDERGHLICPSLTKMLEQCEIEGKCIHYPPEKWKGLWARALIEKRSLYVNEAPWVPPGHPVIHNNLASPILFQGKVIGLLNLANKETGYTDEDQEMLETIAGRVAPVLYAWIQRKLRENERARADEVLRQSEERVRLKLEGILSPEGDTGNLELADVLDSEAVQALMEDFYKLARMPMSIIDLRGNLLVGVGWQEICTKFHRAHPETCKNCLESDLELSSGVPPGEFKLYKCKNNMWDLATPLMVGGKQAGNLFMGQFFFEDEPLDYELFRSQAKKYGFDEAEYIAALEAVPRLSRESLDAGKAFFMKLADILSKLSYSNLKLARSLTQRDTLMVSLKESEGRLERAQEIAHLGSWELNHVNNILTWSDEVYRIFGLRPQEFGATYEAFLEYIHPEDRSEVDAAYAGSVLQGKDSYEIEHRVVRKGGEVRWVHEKCEHFRDASGRIIRSVGMVHDITGRKQAEADVLKLSEDMAARNVELELLNRELEAFIYSISHDLRAPLRHISGFVEILKEDYAGRLDNIGIDHLERIQRGSEKMSRLIADLLHLSKVSRQEMEKSVVDLSNVASLVVEELREADPGRNVRVEIKKGVKAFADRRMMEIVLTNLFGNAWKFTAKTDSARIEFGVTENPPRRPYQKGTAYYVKDNGAGFAPEYMEKMFWPFHRLHSDKEFEGTGIGLSIVERIIRRHGGRVWAEGEVGKGATVYFTLE